MSSFQTNVTPSWFRPRSDFRHIFQFFVSWKVNSLDHDEQKNVNELRDVRLQNQMKTVKEFSLDLHNRNTWIEMGFKTGSDN